MIPPYLRIIIIKTKTVMNKREVISAVAERSGISPEVCTQVLDTFEDVFTEEISRSKWKDTIFEHVYNILTRIKEKKHEHKNN